MPQKGIDLLIQAFAQIAGQFPEWSLVIWGEGPERSNLIELSKSNGTASRVHLPGVTSFPGEWIWGAGGFVLSSRYEGFPNALLEAMSAGLPVLATDCETGPSELIEDGVDGLLVLPGSVNDLAIGIAKFLGDERLRVNLGAQARKVVKRYSAERVMSIWSALVEAAIRDRPGKSDRVIN